MGQVHQKGYNYPRNHNPFRFNAREKTKYFQNRNPLCKSKMKAGESGKIPCRKDYRRNSYPRATQFLSLFLILEMNFCPVLSLVDISAGLVGMIAGPGFSIHASLIQFLNQRYFFQNL